jgi:hypothetical protein
MTVACSPPARIGAITVQDGELAGFAFVCPAAVGQRVTPLVVRRIAACLEALASGTVACLPWSCDWPSFTRWRHEQVLSSFAASPRSGGPADFSTHSCEQLARDRILGGGR